MEKEKRQQWTSSGMYPIVQQWEKSGKSQASFAREEGLPQAVFQYWLRKYRAAHHSPSSGFLAVKPAGVAGPTALSGTGGQLFARLVLPNGAELHFHQSVPGAYLREVLGC